MDPQEASDAFLVFAYSFRPLNTVGSFHPTRRHEFIALLVDPKELLHTASLDPYPAVRVSMQALSLFFMSPKAVRCLPR